LNINITKQAAVFVFLLLLLFETRLGETHESLSGVGCSHNKYTPILLFVNSKTTKICRTHPVMLPLAVRTWNLKRQLAHCTWYVVGYKKPDIS